MPQITTSGGVRLAYETMGSASDPPVLFVQGFGTQLIGWPLGFCERVARGGRFVIAFDNRDCGLSEKFDGQGPALEDVIAAVSAGDFARARSLVAYTLSDMAADGLGLLSALGIERAHVVGASMGGMIAQTMAIERPDRVLTLTSMMSTTGELDFGQASPQALQALLTPAPSDREGYIAAAERALTWRSRRYPDLAEARALAAESYDRSYYPEGQTRQAAAVIASGSRADALSGLRVPTLVIHGRDDTLVAPDGGERTASLIPEAELLLVDDMGHDRPQALWPLLCQAILDHTAGQPGDAHRPALDSAEAVGEAG